VRACLCGHGCAALGLGGVGAVLHCRAGMGALLASFAGLWCRFRVQHVRSEIFRQDIGSKFRALCACARVCACRCKTPGPRRVSAPRAFAVVNLDPELLSPTQTVLPFTQLVLKLVVLKLVVWTLSLIEWFKPFN
jgi:hypothetical protein